MRNDGKCWKCDVLLVPQPGDYDARITDTGACAKCGQRLGDVAWAIHLESQVAALTASLASMTKERDEYYQDWQAMKHYKKVRVDALTASLATRTEERDSYLDAVTLADKEHAALTASLASVTKERDALADEQCGSECVKAHGELAELRKRMAWYERVAEAAQVSDRYRGKTVEEDHVAGRCGCDPMVGFSDPDCCIDRGISQALASPPSQGEQK